MQTRLPAQLEACCDPACRAERHQPSDSDLPFRPRPNYAVLSSVLAALLFSASGAAQARTINAASPSLGDVTNAIASAVDGDTVIVPAGTASWTSGLTITKGITLIGQTTTNPVAKTANDQTIILDDVVRPPSNSNPIIALNPGAGKICRVSGFSFRPGSVTATNFNGAIVIKGPQSTAVRFDHCHLTTMHQMSLINISAAVYGVIDHNVLDFPTGNQSFVLRMGNWNGNADGQGDGSWADPPFYGSEKFMFIEDNCLNNTSGSDLAGNIDGDYGARWVLRHNHIYDIYMSGHGMEGRLRSIRAVEMYNNDFHYAFGRNLGGIRGGSLLVHDNTYDGLVPIHTYALQTYRTFYKFSTFLGASGDNPWDLNDTEGNGTNVPGHAPFTYDSGTATSGSTTTITDTSKNWTTNQWVGFTARRLSDSGIAFIQSNTNNTLTVYYRNAPPQYGPTWTAGDQYQIHKLLAAMDQNGRGQGDLITGVATPINSTTGTAAWPHQALEPCYSWNNIYTPNGTQTGQLYQGDGPAGLLLQGRDFFNNTPKPGYTPYTYPHPLVGGASPTPAQTPSAPQNLRVIGP